MNELVKGSKRNIAAAEIWASLRVLAARRVRKDCIFRRYYRERL